MVLAVHVAVSVGWVGAVAAYVALDLTTALSEDAAAVRAAYLGMGLVVRSVIVPLALAALVTGVVVSVGTKWGLLRHWWVVISLLLTVLAVVVLLSETRVIAALAATAADPSTTDADLLALPNTLVHSIGGVLVLLVVLFLNTIKPRGLTPWGWRTE